MTTPRIRAPGPGDLIKSNGQPHPLGRIQETVLSLLVERGKWFRGCGWKWDNSSTTEKVMETLVPRGLAILAYSDGPFMKAAPTYFPTEAGIAVANMLKGVRHDQK